ncbi:primosomal protein DnaI [Klebsiella variicola subsp. variicola]|nr:primosomal protein DnaI [Klebsiella variicola subsp. variicola]
MLELEARLARPGSDIALDPQFFEDHPRRQLRCQWANLPCTPTGSRTPIFQRLAALWGIALSQPVTPEELAAFVAYWQAEGKVFHHVQWQQKLARSVQISRASNGGQPKRDVNSVSEPDSHIPRGFRG